MADDTRVDVLIKRIKNDKWLSLVVTAGIVFLALVSFAKALQEAGSIFARSASIIQYDASTKDALIAAAHEVDFFLLKIESSFERVNFQSVAPEYIKIKADLRSILLRNRVRPLNECSTKQSELLLDQWSNLEKLLRQPDGSIPAAMRISRDIMFQGFDAMLTLEEAKR